MFLALLPALLAGCTSDTSPGAGGPRPRLIAVRAVPAKPGQLERSITSTGTTFPLAEVKIMPRTDGQIATITVREGSAVRKGDLLIQLDDAIASHQLALAGAELGAARARLKKLRAGNLPEEIKRAEAEMRQSREAVNRTKAELASAQAQLHEAKENLAAFEDLFRQGVVSSQRRLNWQTTVGTTTALLAEKAAKLREQDEQLAVAEEKLVLVRRGSRSEDIEAAANEVQRAEANERLLRTRLEYTKITAPFAGIIAERLVEEGDLASLGKHLLTLVDLAELRARAPVSEIDLPDLRVGQDATIHFDAFPKGVFHGRIASIFPTIDPVSRQGTVEVVLPNASGELKAGLFARLSMSLGKRSSALLIPRSALARLADGEMSVFVLDPAAGEGGPPGGPRAQGAGGGAAGAGGKPGGRQRPPSQGTAEAPGLAAKRPQDVAMRPPGAATADHGGPAAEGGRGELPANRESASERQERVTMQFGVDGVVSQAEAADPGASQGRPQATRGEAPGGAAPSDGQKGGAPAGEGRARPRGQAVQPGAAGGAPRGGPPSRVPGQAGGGPGGGGPGGPQGPLYTVRRVVVQVGLVQDNTAEVLGGLGENQLVLLSGLSEIPVGARVRVRE
ncbi:MAG: efflux RND transporter periplasmic adaptor subunit [Candidatus Tectomicrobia bacterium]|nr:efflux RND transporter periplasmic adaptor subunit [Candidatus Tectomicrobia bacterium]